MATIKDIAKRAGVSHGTASNVLNHRGNVSMEKILRVEQAARELGYSIDERGQVLRKGQDRSIAVVLPTLLEERYALIYSTVCAYARERGFSCQLYLTEDIPDREEAVLSEIASKRCMGVLLISCITQGSDALRLLLHADTTLVCLERPVTAITGFVGFDAETIADALYKGAQDLHPSHVTFISGLFSSANEKNLFEQLEHRFAPSVQVRSLQTEPGNGIVAAFTVSTHMPELIITTSMRVAQDVQDVLALRDVCPRPALMALSCTNFLPQSRGVRSVALNWRRAARISCAMLFHEMPLQSVLLRPEEVLSAVNRPVIPSCAKLSALMLDGPDTDALRQLLPDFKRATGIEVNIAAFPYNELHDTLLQQGSSGIFDVLRMDVVWMEELATRCLEHYSADDPSVAPIFEKMLREVIAPYSRVGNDIVAFPFTPNVQMMFYRQDLFDDAKVRRAYYEKTRMNLCLPQDYTQYCELLHFFSQGENPSSPIEYGASVASRTLSSIVGEFLPIFYSLGGEMFSTDGKPTLDTPQGLHALEIYLEMAKNSLPVRINGWWQSSVENFTCGRTAMLNMFINHVFGIKDLRKSKVAGRIGFGKIPGGKPLLGGGVLGVSSSSKNKEAALEFIRWATSERISTPFTLLGGISPCASVYENEDLLTLYPWLRIAPENFSIAVSRRVPNEIQEQRVENAIGLAIKNSLSGVCTPEQTLKHAQRELEKLLEK